MNAFKMAGVLTVCQSGEISPNLVTLREYDISLLAKDT